MDYEKKIEVTSTGMVVAEVIKNDRRCGIAFFSQFISTNKAIERSLKKAHSWADERIKICYKYERGL